MVHTASALAFLHVAFDHPIRHYDIRLANVLLDADCRTAKLADMGLAKLFLKESSSTTMVPSGELQHLDPLFMQTHKYTPSSDVYSFGLLLLQTITCQTKPAKATRLANSAKSSGSYVGIVDSSMPG